MSDDSFLSGIAEDIGGVLEPLSAPLDLLGMGAQGLAARPAARDIWSALGSGLKEAALAGPAGLAAGGAALIQAGSEMSARDRLLFGGLLVAGGVGAAKALHHRWSPTPRMMTPTGLPESAALGLGLPGDLSEDAVRLQWERPGLRGRTASILAPKDNEAAARALARFAPDEIDPRTAGMAGVMDGYEAIHPFGADGARQDWARFDYAIDRGLLSYEHNKPIRDLYEKFANGNALKDSEAGELVKAVQALGDATRNGIVADDLTIGLSGRVTGVDIVDGNAVLHVSTIPPDPGSVWTDQQFRGKRVEMLNPRAHAAQGKANLAQLLATGLDDVRIREHALGEPRLPKPLEVGPDWYFTEHNNIARGFGLDPNEITPELDRAVAVTSLTSEAQEWGDNIAVAKRISQYFDDARVKDDDFQNWLQDGSPSDWRKASTKRVYAGSKAAAKRHAKLLDELHKELNSAGLKTSTNDLKKILRLARETPSELFASTSGPKQKNFYLNLLYPGLEYPVTVDMHMFNAFYGLDTGMWGVGGNVGPTGTLGDGAQVYDVIADSLRQLAIENDLLPHQAQAVIWETWKSMKSAHKGNWGTQDPFRLKPPGGENPVFLTLKGEGEAEVFASLFGARHDQLPAAALENGSPFEAVLMPDGPVAYSAEPNPYSDQTMRQLYPAVLGADRIPRWVQTRPRWVHDPSHIDTSIGAHPKAHIETYNTRALIETLGDYPGHGAQEMIIFDADPGFSPKGFLSRQQVVDLGGVEVKGVARDHAEVFRQDLADEATVRQIMDSHAWVIVSDDGKAALGARKAGYDPIKVGEDSWLVIGPDGDEALAWSPDARRVLTSSGQMPLTRDALDAAGLSDVRPMSRQDFSNPETPRTREVTPGEFTALAARGRDRMAALEGARSAPAALDGPSWGRVKDTSWDSVQEEWGGATIDTHTGAAVDTTAERYAVTVRPAGTETVEIPIGASRAEFDEAMERAKELWGGDAFQTQQAHIGVFRNEDIGKYEIDPILVVDNLDDVESIGAFTRAHGGAYRFDDGNGYWPPHVREGAPEEFRVSTMDGDEVAFTPDLPEEFGGVERSVRRVQRYALPVDRDRVSALENIAADLKQRGASNLVIHTTRTDLKDFVRAREHTFTDGMRTVVSRSRYVRYGEPNGVPVWVENNANLPDVPLDMDVPAIPLPDGAVLGNTVRLRGAQDLSAATAWNVDGTVWEMSPAEGGPVTRSGDKWTIDATDAPDVAPAVRQAEVLRAAGVDAKNIELKTAQGKFKLQPTVDPAYADAPTTVKTKWGGTVVAKPFRNTSPADTIHKGQFTVSPQTMVFNKRTGKMMHARMEQPVVDSVNRGLESFLDNPLHEQAAEVWRLPGVTLEGTDLEALAYVDWEVGSPVLLTKDYWLDAPGLRGMIGAQEGAGYITPSTDQVAARIAHELGHVFHGATVLQQAGRLSENAEVNKALRRLMKGSNVATDLSERATFDVSELVAESFANVLFGMSESRVARRVYDLVTGTFEDSMKYRSQIGWRSA